MQKGISTLIGIIIIIVVAIVSFGSVFSYQYYSNLKTKQQKNPTACTMEAKICPDDSVVGRTGPNCEFAECPVIPNQTADWKTYKNTQYGFEIKYPSDYKSQEIPIDSPTGLSINLPHGNAIVHEINNEIININLPDDCMFNLSALEDKNMLSFIETKQINGINFYYYKNYLSQQKYLGAYCGMSSGCQSRDVYRTFYKGKCYEMAYDRSSRVFYGIDKYKSATQEEMKVPEVFNQIVFTFKFTK